MKALFIAALLLCQCQLVFGSDTPARRGLAIAEDGRTFIFNDGDWDDAANLPGAPPEASLKVKEAYLPDRALAQADGGFTVALKYRGIFSTDRTASSWQLKDSMQKRNVVFDSGASRRVMGLGEQGKFALHKHGILFESSGKFKPTRNDFSKIQYFTAVHATPGRIYIGTSLNGLYASRNYKAGVNLAKRKILFKKRFSGLPYIPHNKSFYMFEEITAIHQVKNGDLYVGTSVNAALYHKPARSNRFKKLSWPQGVSAKGEVRQITSTAGGERLWISTSSGLVEVTVGKGKHSMQHIRWEHALPDQPGRTLLLVQDATEPSLWGWDVNKTYFPAAGHSQLLKGAAGKRLFYSSAYNYKTRRRKVQAMLSRDHYNGIVIDLKDDFGYIRYHSKVPFLKKVRALRPMLKLPELLKYAHDRNRYVVARLVVFKDPVLYRRPGFAILDKHTKKPWKAAHPAEKWIDPYNPALATDYYIPLLKELEQLGIDEIQLDYIRFPSDGPTWRTLHRHRKAGMYYSEAIENFLHRLNEAVNIPLGVDVYGYHGIYRASGVIGQDIDAFSAHIDVVSPMLYSSHFGPRYLTNRPRKERAYNLLRHCAQRYNYLANGRYLVRPYLQAFPMRNRLWGYGRQYFLDQIKGGTDEGVDGYVFWGAFKHLRQVERAIAWQKEKAAKSGP